MLLWSVVPRSKSSPLNNRRRLVRCGFEAGMVLWELQGPGILMRESCNSW